jgi:hypothetical protein
MTTHTTAARRSYYWVSPRGFSNEGFIFVTRRPKAMDRALDVVYGSNTSAHYGCISRRTAISDGSWATNGSDYPQTLEDRIQAAEDEGNAFIALHVGQDDQDDLGAVVREIETINEDLADAVARRDELIRDAARRMSQSEIARITGLSVQRVSQLVKS